MFSNFPFLKNAKFWIISLRVVRWKKKCFKIQMEFFLSFPYFSPNNAVIKYSKKNINNKASLSNMTS